MSRPHPKLEQIRALLTEGHTNSHIRTRTGADVTTIARIRAREAFGPATITNRGGRPHPKDAEIRALITAGKNNHAIARELHTDRVPIRRIRKETGIPNPPLQPLTLEQKWAARTKPVDGGHLEWTGERVGPGRSPTMRYKETSHSPTAIAFQIKHGRPPQGYAIAECELNQCVAPDHVDDEAGRFAKRQQLRLRNGLDDRPDTCPDGHDQSIHGRLQGDGRPYCKACKRAQKTEPRERRQARASARAAIRRNITAQRQAEATARARRREAVRRDIETLLRQDVPQMHIARRLGVGPLRVQRVREALGLPAPQRGPRERYASLAEAFHAHTTPADDGHLRWASALRGTPHVRFRQQRVPATRVAFELHHGRPPVGRVLTSCDTDGCLSGAHLTDQLMRAANRRADKAFASIFGTAA